MIQNPKKYFGITTKQIVVLLILGFIAVSLVVISGSLYLGTNPSFYIFSITNTPKTIDIQQIKLAEYLLMPTDFIAGPYIKEQYIVANQYEGPPNQRFLKNFHFDNGFDTHVVARPIIGLDGRLNNAIGSPIRIFTQEITGLSGQFFGGYLVMFVYDTEVNAYDTYSKYFQTFCYESGMLEKNIVRGESSKIIEGAFCEHLKRYQYIRFVKCNFIIEVYVHLWEGDYLNIWNLIDRLDNLCVMP